MAPESHKDKLPTILYRPIERDESEFAVAGEYLPVYRARTAMRQNQLVICRYSCLPFYDDLQIDADYVGATLVHTLREHNYLADMRNWVEDVGELTPKTWYRLEDIDEPGPYVLKGKTNSRKFDWSQMMYAPDLAKAREISWKLSSDGFVGQQDIYIRKYIPLKTFFRGINDLPVTSEFRYFTLYGRVICGAYYWSNYAEDLTNIPQPLPHHTAFVEKVLSRISGKAHFVVVDIAETEQGELTLIELNDGQMSGLSMNDPKTLYSGLSQVLYENLRAVSSR